MPKTSAVILRPLLFACLLGMGCGEGDPPVVTSASTGTTATTTSGTGPSATGSGTRGDTAGDTTSGSSGSASSGTGSDPVGPCMTTCEHLVGCGIEDVPNCAIPCVGQPEIVAGCEALYIAQQECVSALSCPDATAWREMTGDPYPCEAEDQALADCLPDA